MGNTTRSCCGGHATDDTPTQKLVLTTSPAQADDAIAQCPVMAGTPVEKASTETVPDFTTNLIDQLEPTGPAGP
jgi:hypothetical protein